MAKSSKSSKKSKQDDKDTSKKAAAKAAEKKAAEKAKAKAAAKLASLAEDAKKARKTADAAVKAAEKAEAKAAEAGAPDKRKPQESELLKLALRSTEARLTDAERKVEQLERQIADFHTLDDQVVENAIEDAIVDAAVQATVADAVLDAELAAPVTAAEEAEVIAAELEEIAAQAQPVPEEPSHDGDAAAAAQVFAAGDAGAEPTVTPSELTPPLPEPTADDVPNDSWTLLRLRAEAKRRGLTGTSNLPKAALVARLTA